MIANAPYIDYKDCIFNFPIVNEYIIDTSENNDSFENTLSFLNVNQEVHHIISTEEVVNNEQNLSKQISDITTVLSFIEKAPLIFASSTTQFVLSAFEKMRDGLMQLSLDCLSTDISQEDECLFMYGQKNNIKLFFNLFFEENDVETLVNVSTSRGKYIIEDNIENSLQQLFEIFQKESSYENIS